MKHYPSIDGHIVNAPMIAFDKLDGSQIRADLTRKNGLHKFGSRNVLLGKDHPHLGKAQSLVLDKYGEQLNRIFRDRQWEKLTCFFEFYGPNSFAGIHDPNDAHDVILFDVDVYKKGLMLPREFIRTFGAKVEIPGVLHDGNPTQDFVESVKNSSLLGMTYEGVVCKGAPLKNGYPPHFFKIKSLAWITRVKSLYGDDPKKLADLL